MDRSGSQSAASSVSQSAYPSPVRRRKLIRQKLFEKASVALIPYRHIDKNAGRSDVPRVRGVFLVFLPGKEKCERQEEETKDLADRANRSFQISRGSRTTRRQKVFVCLCEGVRSSMCRRISLDSSTRGVQVWIAEKKRRGP